MRDPKELESNSSTIFNNPYWRNWHITEKTVLLPNKKTEKEFH